MLSAKQGSMRVASALVSLARLIREDMRAANDTSYDVNKHGRDGMVTDKQVNKVMQSPRLLGERVELKWGVKHQDHAQGAITEGGNVRCDGCGDVFGRAKFERHSGSGHKHPSTNLTFLKWDASPKELATIISDMGDEDDPTDLNRTWCCYCLHDDDCQLVACSTCPAAFCSGCYLDWAKEAVGEEDDWRCASCYGNHWPDTPEQEGPQRQQGRRQEQGEQAQLQRQEPQRYQQGGQQPQRQEEEEEEEEQQQRRQQQQPRQQRQQQQQHQQPQPQQQQQQQQQQKQKQQQPRQEQQEPEAGQPQPEPQAQGGLQHREAGGTGRSSKKRAAAPQPAAGASQARKKCRGGSDRAEGLRSASAVEEAVAGEGAAVSPCRAAGLGLADVVYTEAFLQGEEQPQGQEQEQEQQEQGQEQEQEQEQAQQEQAQQEQAQQKQAQQEQAQQQQQRRRQQLERQQQSQQHRADEEQRDAEAKQQQGCASGGAPQVRRPAGRFAEAGPQPRQHSPGPCTPKAAAAEAVMGAGARQEPGERAASLEHADAAAAACGGTPGPSAQQAFVLLGQHLALIMGPWRLAGEAAACGSWDDPRALQAALDNAAVKTLEMGRSLLPLIERTVPASIPTSSSGNRNTCGSGGGGGSDGGSAGAPGHEHGSNPKVADACVAAEELVKQAAERRGAARAHVLCDAVERLADAWHALQQSGACRAAGLERLLRQLRAVLTL